MRILMVDDDAGTLSFLSSVIKKFFRERVCEITCRTEGYPAIAAARGSAFDVILLDLTLPDLHGLDVLGVLKSDERTKRVPVVILSGSLSHRDITQAFKLGAEDYILKPFEPLRVNIRIQAIMRSHKAFADLEATQGRLTNIMDSLKAVVWSYSPGEGKLTYCSGAARDVYGLAPEKLVEDPALWPSLVHPEDRERVLAALGRGQTSDAHEYRIVDSRGRTRWLSERFKTVLGEAGETDRIDGITTDISSRKFRELALSEAQMYAQNLVECSLDMIIAVDQNRRIVEFNRAAEETFRYRREEVIGECSTLLYAPGTPSDEVFVQTTTRGRFVGEVRWRRSDGEVFPALLSATPIKDADDKIVGIMGIARDVTERKRREAQLALLESAVSHLEEAIMITDGRLQPPGPSIVFVNSAFSRMTGYARDEVLGRSPRILQGANTDLEVLAAVRQAQEAGLAFVAESVNYRKDGSDYTIRWHLSPVPDEQGEIRHWISVQIDISERKKVQAELEQSRKLRAIGEIAGGVAHEFSNLLSPMMIQTGLIAKNRSEDKQLAEMLRPVRTAIKQAAALNQSILTLGRKSSDKREIMGLNPIVEDAARLVGSTGDQRIRFSLKLDSSLDPIWLVRSQIAQIVINLGFNARDTLAERMEKEAADSMDASSRDWTPQLSISTCFVRKVPDKRCQSKFSRTIDCQCLVVEDNGMGMSPAVVKRLFEPFFTTKTDGRGTGLGMAVVWSIVDNLGGWVAVKSTPGEGTRFEVYFPQYVSGIPGVLAQAPVEPEPNWEAVQRLRILFVEDNELVSGTIGKLLSEDGHDVTLSPDGQDAWKRISADPQAFDVVISDINMPNISGVELCGLIQKTTFKGKILFSSGYLTPDQSERLTALGVKRILRKPYDADVLMEAIAEMFSHEPQVAEPVTGVVD